MAIYEDFVDVKQVIVHSGVLLPENKMKLAKVLVGAPDAYEIHKGTQRCPPIEHTVQSFQRPTCPQPVPPRSNPE